MAKFPARVKCASLAWKTLERALEGDGASTVTTDERSDSGEGSLTAGAAAGSDGDSSD